MMNSRIGALMLAAGVMLLALGYLGRQAAITSDSIPIETVIWYFIAGTVSTAVGLFAVAGCGR